MFENVNFDGHERVIHHYDEETSLRAIIAIHSTALGPAGGGCRLWNYGHAEDALSDALRLARGMSYKNALAGLNMGGGKAVLLGPIGDDIREKSFHAFGRAVDSLAGAYVTAEDVGVRVEDMRAVAEVTKFVSGLSSETGAGGDPSPYTARGVSLGIQAAVKHGLGRDTLEGLTVAIQGLGGVGGNLAGELSAKGARLVVADVDKAKVEAVCDTYHARPANIEDILLQEVDVLAPCALGGAITDAVAGRMCARIIAGGANNQVASPSVGEGLMKRGILYAPDYVINAGGIIMVAAEYFGENAGGSVLASVDRIYERTLYILDRARVLGRFPGEVADEMARNAIRAGKANRAAGVEQAVVSA